MNKASGNDEISVELFQVLKDDAMKVLHSICQQVWKTQQWPQDWKRSVFIPGPKAMPKNAQTTTQLHSSHMLQSNAENSPSQASALHEHELPDIQARFRKGRGTTDQIANIQWIVGKAREFQKNIYFCFIDYAKAFDCVDHSKLSKILKEKGILYHLTCLLRNLYVDQEATVRTGHGTMNWFQIRKGVYCHPVILSRLYIVTLLIELICRAHHAKCRAG